jgi:hypothetical protein
MANGHFDFCIWYNNEWQEVMGGLEAKYRSANTLKNGVKVNFDRTTGRWVPVMPSIQE